MENVYILSKEEVTAIKELLGEFSLSHLYTRPLLASAITKLLGDGEPKPYGMPTGSSPEYDVQWRMKSSGKINLIKAVRNMSGKGLKESKDFVDARSYISNDHRDALLFRPSELNREFHELDALRRIHGDVEITLV